MPSSATLLTLAAAISSASAAYQGFNYGSSANGGPKVQSDFEAEFNTAAGLAGTNGDFNSARLYTMIQYGSASDPISAIPAAIDTKTSLLLGLWGGGGQSQFNNEIAALQKTISQYCGKLDGLVAGISVGSEDLYRNSPMGIAAGSNPGENPDVLVSYIKQVRNAIKGSCLKDTPIGHVDTWTVYVNGSNQAVIDAVDWVGMDAYAYYEDTKNNVIENGKNLFLDALGKTKGASGGKPVWITETGWPVSGKTVGGAVANKKNAKTFWDEVGCPLFGTTNTWWFSLQGDEADASFGVIGNELTKTPRYDLSCDNVKEPVTSTKTSDKTSDKATTKTSVKTTIKTSEAAVTTTMVDSESTSSAAAGTTSSAGSGNGAIGGGGDDGDMTTTMSTVVPVTTTVVGDDSTSTPATTSESEGDSGATPTEGDSGSGTTDGPSEVPTGSGSQKLNSMGAAAVAVVLAAAIL